MRDRAKVTSYPQPSVGSARCGRTWTPRAARSIRSTLFAAIALTFCATAYGGVPPVGQTVGVFVVDVPPSSRFVLHGTMPIPRGVYPRTDGTSPFQIRGSSGELEPAQAEIVSRYPSDADGADVVELLASVARPDSVVPGSRIEYEVVYAPFAPAPFDAEPNVSELLATQGALVLRATDVFGNRYEADLLSDFRRLATNSLRTLKNGQTARQVATHEIMRPTTAVAGPNGTLPHMMGVHSYVTQWARERFFSLDLRVHNALSGADRQNPADDPMDKLYFRSLELRLPPGWRLLNAFPDPYFGAPYDENGWTVWPIVAPTANGKMHMMPIMSQMERRLAVAFDGWESRAQEQIEQAGLGFCRAGRDTDGSEFYSWWNSDTARYFPQRQRLPSLDHVDLGGVLAADAGHLAHRMQIVAAGTAGIWPVISPGLGWAHPWGVSESGMVSGMEIFLYDGITTAAAASCAGYRLAELTHRMYTDRQPNVLYNKSGRPTRVEQWLVQTQSGATYLPIWWYNGPMLWATDPFGFRWAPKFQVDAVAAANLQPDYEPELSSYEAIDEAHLIRYTHNAKVLAWLGNDSLAKDDLCAQAEGIRFAYPDWPQDLWGGIIPTGLLAARNFTTSNPGQGFAYGRGEAWGLDTMCAAFSLQDPGWRRDTRAWFGEVANVLEAGQMDCTGIIQSTPLYNVFDSKYRCRQSIEAAITENAIVGMRESVFAGAEPARVAQVNEILRKTLYAMISPLVWSDSDHGPWALMATGSINSYAPYCTYWPADGNYGFADHYQVWSSLAYGYELTGDPIFLTKAQEMLGAPVTEMHSNALNNIENDAALLALVQRLYLGL